MSSQCVYSAAIDGSRRTAMSSQFGYSAAIDGRRGAKRTVSCSTCVCSAASGTIGSSESNAAWSSPFEVHAVGISEHTSRAVINSQP